MPRTIDELKSFIPSHSEEPKFDNDPSKNDLYGNMQLLSDKLTSLPYTYDSRAASMDLTTIIDTVDGYNQGDADRTINTLETDLNTFYRTHLDPKANHANLIQDEKERALLTDIVGYVAAGLGIDMECVQEKHKTHAAEMEAKGKDQVEKQKEDELNKEEEEKAEREKIYGSVLKDSYDSGNNFDIDDIDEKKKEELSFEAEDIKNNTGDPVEEEENLIDDELENELEGSKRERGSYSSFNAYKTLEVLKDRAEDFKAVSSEAGEEERAYLDSLCVKIMATRRASNAERNNKELLKKSQFNEKDRDEWEQALSESPTFKAFLKTKSTKDLAKLAADGHGGKLEDEFKRYVKYSDQIPKDVPDDYMPKALERTEILQKKITSSGFRSLDPDKRHAIYSELLATRSAVEAVRSDKKSLDRSFTAEDLDDARERFMGDHPEKYVVKRVVTMHYGDIAKKAATAGHGGALEDIVKASIREESKSSKNGFVIPDANSRYIPTIDERRSDIKEILSSPNIELGTKQGVRLSAELFMLDKKLSGTNLKYSPDAKPDGSVRRYNHTADTLTQAITKLGSEAESVRIIEAAKQGPSELRKAMNGFKREHAGVFEAFEKQQDIEDRLAEAKTDRQIKRLAVEQSVLNSALADYKKHGNSYQLLEDLSFDNFNSTVNDIFESEEFTNKYNRIPADKRKEATEKVVEEGKKSFSSLQQEKAIGQAEVQHVRQ